MESHGTKRVYRTQWLRMRRQRYTGMCPSSLRSHREMELISLTRLSMIKKPTSGLYLNVSLTGRQNCGTIRKEQTKYIELRAGIKREYKSIGVYQINIVVDFLGGHHEQLRNDLRSITSTGKQLSYLIERCRK